MKRTPARSGGPARSRGGGSPVDALTVLFTNDVRKAPDPAGSGAFSGFPVFFQQGFRQLCPGPAHGGSQQDAAQNVGGPVDVKV